MLWQQYVFSRGPEVHETWDGLYRGKTVRLLYIAGKGFDVRAQTVMKSFVQACRSSAKSIETATLLMVDFAGYELSPELHDLTRENAAALEACFSCIGSSETVHFGFSDGGEDDISPGNALRIGTEKILARVPGHTDIALDVSTMPRVVYVTLMTSLLEKLIPDKNVPDALVAGNVNLQMLVAEDANLDAHIQSEDPSNDLILIPGFSSPLQAESVRDWPLVWFPILGENRVSQFQKVLEKAIPRSAEICPVLPHPSRNPRRADKLLIEYKAALFDTRQTPASNVLYAHEGHPFEAYRQLLRAMQRYRTTMGLMGGCRLIVTPLGSKLITLGASLACYEMRTHEMTSFGVGIPYAEPRRYVASPEDISLSQPEICSMLLTGEAYAGSLAI